jgi:hypothetical protein
LSQEEQDAILGRLTRQHGESLKQIAALEAKVTEDGEYLKHSGNALAELGRREIRLDVEFLQKLDKQAILSTIEELRTERRNAERLNAQLQKLR